MPASNTKECFTTFIDHKVVGYLAGPRSPSGTKFTHVIVFDDGRGLGFYSNGAFTVVSKSDIEMGIAHLQKQLDENIALLEAHRQLAGKLPRADDDEKEKKSGKKKVAKLPAKPKL